MNMQVNRIAETIWEIPTTEKEGMLVPARIYATEQLFNAMDETVYDQITNVATLPGITKYAMCMPDGHSGYGFPIGGVAAMDVERGGVISPGGIGFDINCGMRLVVTNLTYEEVKPHIQTLVDRLFQRVPAGVGSTGFVKLSRPEFRRVVEQGARWCIQNGYGWPEDLELTEESGCIAGADAAKISDKAIDRGVNQIGTLGSGNHYLEIQVAHREHIHDEELARRFGITIPDQVVIMFHCGSRGFGHQVATDYLQVFLRVMESKYRIKILDRELACAPFNTPEGRDYFAAMKCGLNMSFANRQVILHRIREVFSARLQPLGRGSRHAHGVRRGPQHGQAGAPPRRWGGAHAAGASQGRDPRLWAAHGRSPGTLPGCGTTHHPRRQHGDRLLPAGGRPRRGANLLQHGPRQRPHHEPDQSPQAMARRQTAARDGGTGHLRAHRLLVGPGRGGRRRL